jgi:hypothetical protein
MVEFGLVTFALSCATPPEAPEKAPEVWRGEHIVFRTESSKPICSGTLPYIDRHLAVVSDALGVEPPIDVDYTWIPDLSGLQAYCAREDSLGCAKRYKEVYSIYPAHCHEVSHVVVNSEWELSNRIVALEEGLAEVLACGAHPFSGAAPPSDWIEEPWEGDYGSAARFVQFLIERNGLRATARWIATGGRKAVDYENSYSLEFDESFDDAIADFSDYPKCGDQEYRIAFQECTAPLTPHVDGVWQLEFDLECSSPTVRGPREDRVWTSQTIRTTVDNVYAVTLEGTTVESDTTVDIVRCAPCSRAVSAHITSDSVAELNGVLHDRTPEFPAGLYYVEVSQPAEHSEYIIVQLDPIFP